MIDAILHFHRLRSVPFVGPILFVADLHAFVVSYAWYMKTSRRPPLCLPAPHEVSRPVP